MIRTGTVLMLCKLRDELKNDQFQSLEVASSAFQEKSDVKFFHHKEQTERVKGKWKCSHVSNLVSPCLLGVVSKCLFDYIQIYYSLAFGYFGPHLIRQ